jgi:hypothetical protein
MVRAAVSGVIDYTGADPKNRQWRIKHLLTLTEMARREDYELLMATHRHWLALVAHGSLTEESFGNAKTRAIDLLQNIQTALFPWDRPQEKDTKVTPKTSPKKAIMADKSAQELIARYKELNG